MSGIQTIHSAKNATWFKYGFTCLHMLTCYDCDIAKDSSPKMIGIEFLRGHTPKFQSKQELHFSMAQNMFLGISCR